MGVDRWEIFNKYGGRCAYCGEPIAFKGFQVDHFWPQFLKDQDPERLHFCRTDGKTNNEPENLMPACRKCNRHKRNWQIEEWRCELQRQVEMLHKNTQFGRALRFGQVKITESPIVFYFEKVGRERTGEIS